MIENRKVKYLLPSEKIDMGGFPVKQAMPTAKVPSLDPFLLLHHAQVKFNKERPALQQGVGPHPHRGFSPVSFIIEGEIHHRDSHGNNQIAKAGELQWMHAGKGIVHSERPSENTIASGLNQEFIQLWINSPAASKVKAASYQFMDENNAKKFFSEDGYIENKLVAGSYGNLEGNIETESPLLVIWSKAKQQGELKLEIPHGYNLMVYVINGSCAINSFGKVEKETLVIFETEGSLLQVTLEEESQIIILCGEPINEPVESYGPFVMNNQTEIMEAMRDYQMGKMGILIEE